MSLTDQVYDQARRLAGVQEEGQAALLEVLCGTAAESLTARLKDGFQPEDCASAFVKAASLYALAALKETEESLDLEEFKAGDLTVKQGRRQGAAAQCLYRQAEQIIRPYLKDRFCFTGV